MQHRQVWLDETRAALAADAFGPARLRAKPDYQRFHPGWRSLMMRADSVNRWWEDDQMKIANFETARRITFTAIALHRYRGRHGSFPDSLQKLMPEFLAEQPRDFMSGQPLRYRLEADGRFSLWSVGDDLRDDGGDPLRVSGSPIFNLPRILDGRDWVWPKPATEAEVAAYHAELAARRASPAP